MAQIKRTSRGARVRLEGNEVQLLGQLADEVDLLLSGNADDATPPSARTAPSGEPASPDELAELTGLAGQKPWECVGEIEEAAACLYALTGHPEWDDAAIVRALHDDLVVQYGRPRLVAALAGLMIDSADHHIPPAIAARIAPHAL